MVQAVQSDEDYVTAEITMTLLNTPPEPAITKLSPPLFALSQRGRASMEILGSIQKYASDRIRSLARADFEADPSAIALIAEHTADTQGEGGRARISAARRISDGLPMFRLERFIQRYVAEENFNTGIPAIEERREQFERFGNLPIATSAGGTLELDPEVERPRYYEVDWHLEPGGWDGYDLYGPLFAFAVGPLVFSKGGYAAVASGEDIGRQRIDAVRQLPKARYERIYEPGCGGATTLRALNTVFPEAELVGSDLSTLLLGNGHRMAEKLGFKAHLKQRDSLRTGEPDASFDAVITYALHHELPPKANAALFKEMFRIMKPGADIVISDPPPFRAVDLFQAVLLDWETTNRNEPLFSAVLHSSLDDQLTAAGFAQVESYAIGQGSYPWITRAVKPEAPLLATQVHA